MYSHIGMSLLLGKHQHKGACEALVNQASGGEAAGAPQETVPSSPPAKSSKRKDVCGEFQIRL